MLNFGFSGAELAGSAPSDIIDFVSSSTGLDEYVTVTFTNATGSPEPTYNLIENGIRVAMDINSGFVYRSSIVGVNTYSVNAVNGLGTSHSNIDSATVALITYSPMEDDPEWVLLSGAPTNSSITGGVVSILGETSPASTTALGIDVWTDGYIEFNGELFFATPGLTSFPACIRMLDDDTFIGVTVGGGTVAVRSVTAGTDAELIISTYQPEVGTRIKLEAIGEVVNLYYDGILIESGTTTLIAPGSAGMLLRAWSQGAQVVASDFVVGNYD